MTTTNTKPSKLHDAMKSTMEYWLHDPLSKQKNEKEGRELENKTMDKSSVPPTPQNLPGQDNEYLVRGQQ